MDFVKNEFDGKVLKRLITITASTHEEFATIRERIHNQLVGNKDYIDCNIILNGSDDRMDGTENVICVYIFNECEYVPPITIY